MSDFSSTELHVIAVDHKYLICIIILDQKQPSAQRRERGIDTHDSQLEAHFSKWGRLLTLFGQYLQYFVSIMGLRTCARALTHHLTIPCGAKHRTKLSGCCLKLNTVAKVVIHPKKMSS
jgi:hypothetical protein